MGLLGFAVVCGVVGAFVVGPLVRHAVTRWIGWRVVLPVLLGYVPERVALGRQRVAYPRAGVVEGLCGLTFGIAAWRLGWSLPLLPVLVLSTGMVATSTVDIRCWRVPTRFVVVTGVVALGSVGVVAVAGGQPASVWGAVLGGATYFGLLGALHMASPRQLGRGDVRLGLLIGLVVGWVGWSDAQPIAGPLQWVFQAAFAAGVIGLMVGLVLRMLRRSYQSYPFAPWLSLGAFLAIMIGV